MGCLAFANDFMPFKGKVNADDINLRIDSTVSSEIICTVKKDDVIDVLSQAYGWYRIKLPKYAPSFIKDEFLPPFGEKTAKVTKPGVNVRLRPSPDSPIIGKTDKDEIVHIIENKNGWTSIEPVFNSFGWVNAKFIDHTGLSMDVKEISKPQITTTTTKEQINLISEMPQEENPVRERGSLTVRADDGLMPPPDLSPDNSRPKSADFSIGLKTEIEKEKTKISEKNTIQNKDTAIDYQVFEGLIKPYGKIFNRIATHKLVDKDNKVFLLKGSKDRLEAGTYRKAKIKGRLIDVQSQKLPVIEVSSIEVLY